MPGFFITFEGIDGSGKTTQINLLVDNLKKKFPEREIVVSREPGGTSLGNGLREIILHGGDIYKNTELLLYMADRSEHVATKISPALKRGAIVICDRYIDSSLAYQYGGRGFSRDLVTFLNNFSTDSLLPDLTVLLDITAETSNKRVANGSNAPDRLENTGSEFFIRTRNAYLELFDDSQTNDNRIVKIDGTLNVEEIQDVILKEINERLG